MPAPQVTELGWNGARPWTLPSPEDRKGLTMPTVENNRIVETTTEARAGETGHGVRYVLGIGVVTLIVAFAIVYLVFFG
jgi:hypothetical protein